MDDLNILFDLFDLFSPGGNVDNAPAAQTPINNGALASFLDGAAFLGVMLIIATLVVLAAFYVITAFKWQFIGRKAGLQSDWMPFVPFARTVYKLSIVDEAWWRMFFLDGWWLYTWLIYTIINAISDYRWTMFAIILCVLYLLCCVAYNVYWRYKFYTAHNIRPHFSLSILVPIPPLPTIRHAWDYIIAFGRNYPFTGEGTSRKMMDVVDVPQMRDSRGNPVAITHAAVPGRSAPWTPGGQTPPPQPAASSISLTGMSGMYAGSTLPLAPNDELIIGRDNSLCNLIIEQNAEKVSRKHCGIMFDAARGVYQVTDYSSNGTFIDGGNRLAANMPTTLQKGTSIALGSRENRFRLD
ncbi:MAG: FHA domain-containing protein [Oscillospiraceae bacterium]|jgi:hypothetical protein|nr:FHA domain-containing protein [Oscillospiraceae bacterium]